jgi:aspartyl protease family protein
MWPDDPDTLARMFYLLLLLTMVSAGVLVGRRRRLGETLQQMLIWALIFAMIIIAYSFRDTLRGALFPAEAVRVSADEIELRRSNDGHFHATLDLNGARVRFLVDTGASEIVLASADAARAGIDLEALRFTGRAVTANGVVSTAPVLIERVAFAGMTERAVAASVMASDLGHSLLGMSYLNRFSRIEISGDRMVLRR